MSFANPEILWAILAVILFHPFWKKWGLPPFVGFSVGILKSKRSFSPVLGPLILKYAGLIFLILGLARPQTSSSTLNRSVSGIDIMVILDVSQSMNVEDLSEKEGVNRLMIAKETIRNFIKGRVSDRMGLVVFSGEAFTMAPPTLDYGLLLKALEEAETGELRDGTAIGDGLAVGVSRLRESQAKSRVIILLTDGDSNVGQVDPETAGELAEGYGLKIYSIAIGKEGRVRVPIKRKDIFGRTETHYQWQDNALNTEILEKIAKVTAGKFYRVEDEQTLKNVFNEIDSLEKSKVEISERLEVNEHFEWFVLLALLILAMERILGATLLRTFP